MKKKIVCMALMLIMVLSLASCVLDKKYDYDMTEYVNIPTVAGKEIEVKLDAVQATIDQDIISASVNSSNKISANLGDTIKMSITIKEIYWVDKGDGTGKADLTEIKDAQGNVITPEHILFSTDNASTTDIVETITIENLGSGTSFHKKIEEKFDGIKLGQEHTETYRLPADLSPLQSILTAEQYAEILPFADKECRMTYTFTSRQVREGDIVVLDFKGYYMDENGNIKINTEGEEIAFEGGSATGSQVYIGSHLFIEDFEKGLVGFEVGVEDQFKATFPDDYSSEDLKGQTVIFKATVKEIYKPVTYDLDFVKSNYGEYESLEAFEDAIIKSFATQEFLSYFLENTIVIEYPDKEYKFIKNQIEDMEADFASSYGMTFDNYINYYYGFASREEYIKYTMKSEMAYYAYAQANGIEPTDGDISNARAVLIASYQADYLSAYESITEAEALSLATEYVDTQLTDMDIYQEALYSLVGDHFMTQYVVKEVPTTYTSVTKGGSLFTE